MAEGASNVVDAKTWNRTTRSRATLPQWLLTAREPLHHQGFLRLKTMLGEKIDPASRSGCNRRR